MMMMQAFPLPPVLARHCRELESADTLPSVYRQGPMSQHRERCDVKHGHTLIRRMHSDEPSGNSQVCSAATDDQFVLVKADMTTTTTTTTASVRSNSIDCDHHRQQHHQEERDAMSLCRSIFDCDSSSAAADVPCHDFDLHGPSVGTSILGTRSQNRNASIVAAHTIECFNETDISAACLLMDMSASSYSSADVAGEEQSQNQPCSSVRVFDCCDHAAPASLPSREISELASATSSGRSRDADEKVVGTVQETSASWEATYSSTPRSLRLELRTRGKKRIKPRKGEQEVNLFKMNQEVLSADNKCDIFDRPTKKRHYKSLRALLDNK